MAIEQRTTAAILISAALLTWPALWNGYPLVFADTGTYLAQAIEHYLGWDRPVFYSLFLFPLHATLSTWPIAFVQALLAANTLHLTRRVLLPHASPWWLPALVAFLGLTSALPWLASQLMPDFLTSLLVLALALLALAPERLTRAERIWLVLFATFAIAAHQSHLPLAFALLSVLLPLRRLLGAVPFTRADLARAVAPPLLATVALLSVNLAGVGRASLSPYGNVFVLARVIYDGPGLHVLQRDCPQAAWRICRFVGELPANSDDFLWRADGPVARAGGAKLISAEADAIIGRALSTEPVTEFDAFLGNALQQLIHFGTGDGLQPWPVEVTPKIARDFPPREFAAYSEARQTRGTLTVPDWLQSLHISVAYVGLAGSLLLLPLAIRRRHIVAGFLVAALVALLANATITGGLSAVHDRYQSRVAWLPPLLAILAAAALLLWPRIARTGHAANVLWSGLEAALSALLAFASAFIVARLIGPAELGIGAAVVSVHVLLWVMVNALFADALVQRTHLEDTVLWSAIAASTAVGSIAALLQVASAWPLAAVLHDPRFASMAALLALPLPLVGAAGPVQGLLTRERAYRALTLRTLLGQGLGTLAGIGFAFAGAGAWAIVAQQFVNSLAGALTLLVRQRPTMTAIDWNSVKALLRLGLPLTASTLVQTGRYRLFALLIGGTAGAAALGQVHMAFRLVDALRELAFTALWRLTLPILSAHQADLARLRLAMRRCLAWTGLAAFPLCGALAVSIEPLVRLLLGPVWQPAAAAALPLVALAAWLFLIFPAGVAVIARSEARYTLIANLASTVALVAGVGLLRPATPLAAGTIWLGAQLMVAPHILRSNARVLQTTLPSLIGAGAPALGLALLATSAALLLPHAFGQPKAPLALIALRLAIGAAIYLPPALLVARRWLDRRSIAMARSPALSELRGADADLRL
jgi:O-antigen/teichoic acid export membrane protein